MKTRIIVDSTADLLPDIKKRVNTVPLTVRFGEKEFIETDLLNEVPLKSCLDCKISLPLWFWNIFGRVQWMLGNNRQLEVKTETKKRADQLIERLLQENKNCILISHGFYMRTLVNELQQYGFTIDKNKMEFRNLERIVAEK